MVDGPVLPFLNILRTKKGSEEHGKTASADRLGEYYCEEDGKGILNFPTNSKVLLEKDARHVMHFVEVDGG